MHCENPSQTRHASHACAEKEETACGQDCGTNEARTHCASPLGSRLLRICQTLQRFCILQQHTPSITLARIGLSGVRPFRRSPLSVFPGALASLPRPTRLPPLPLCDASRSLRTRADVPSATVITRTSPPTPLHQRSVVAILTVGSARKQSSSTPPLAHPPARTILAQ